MKYDKRIILTDDRNPNGGDDYEAPYPFFVGDVKACDWTEDQGSCGDEGHDLYPAFSLDPAFAGDKGRCWYHSWCWNAAHGYSATGYGSELITFEDGVKRLIEQDQFSFTIPPFHDLATEQIYDAVTRDEFNSGQTQYAVTASDGERYIVYARDPKDAIYQCGLTGDNGVAVEKTAYTRSDLAKILLKGA